MLCYAGIMVRKPLRSRIFAATCYMLATSGLMLHPLHKAQIWTTLADTPRWKDAAAGVSEDKRAFINRWGQRFVTAGNVETKQRSSRKPKPGTITREDALMAAKILKAGHWIDRKDKHGNVVDSVFRHYPSVSRAVKTNDALRAIKVRYNLTCKQLLYHMKLADPNLRRHRVRIKPPVPDNWLHKRKVRARSLYNRCQTQPDWRDRCYFVDECKIWVDDTATDGVHVWCDASDKDFHTTVHYDKANRNKGMKVRFLSVVNPVHGTVYLEFTTGTHDIERLHNKMPSGPNHGPYKVSWHALLVTVSLPTNNNVVVSSLQNPKP